MTRKRWSLNQINLIWSINQPRYIISYKVTHVACSISNIWWRWIFDKEEKEEEEKKTRKRSFLLQRSCCEFEIDPSGKQRKRHRNFLVPRKNFWTNIRLMRPKYLGNYSHRESLVRAYKRNPISKHFRRKYYGNEKKKRKKSLLKLLNIRDFENISRSRLRKIDLIRMHKYIGRIKVSRVIFPFVSFSLPECKLPSQIRFGIDAKYPFETFTCTIWFPKTRSRGGGPRGKFVNPNRRGRKAIKRN